MPQVEAEYFIAVSVGAFSAGCNKHCFGLCPYLLLRRSYPSTACVVSQKPSGRVLCAAGSLALVVQRVVSPKQHYPEEYRLLLKLLHHASHLQVRLCHALLPTNRSFASMVAV